MRLARLLPLFVVLLIVSCFSAQAEGPVDGPQASSGQAQDATVTPGESPGPRSESSFKAEIAGRVSPTELELAPHDLQPMAALPKTEDFEGSWPNDWQLLATEAKYWGPNECLAYGGSYDGWPARFDGTGYPSHTNPPACTVPSGYPLNFQSVMVYGPLSTVGATSGAVDFKALIDTELGYDWGGVIAKTGGNCTDFPGTYNGPIRSGDWGGWIDWSEDLADFSGVGNLLGQANVCIAFLFWSDVIISDYPGFFLDNIDISIDTGPPPEGCWTGGPPLAAGADVPALEPSSEEGEDIGVREATPLRATDESAPGELIVKFAPGVSRGAREAVVRHEGAALSRHLLVPGYALVHVPPGKEEQFLARLEANPNVEMAEPNAIRRVTFVPNDTYYSYQWHMPQIQMEQAWDVASGSGVVVAVIDTGVAYENYAGFAQAPDLAGTAFTPGCDFVNNDYHPNDDAGHGTHVAGTIAQTTNNSLGVAGVAYGATIMPVKVLDSAGSGTVADEVEAIMWATDYGADVINLSLGGGYASAEEAAINYALSNGVVVVAAAGNESASSLSCPACYPGVIAVGATDYNRNRAPYSNYGCGVSGHCLDVVAPGGDTSADENGDTYVDGVLQQTFEFACLGGLPDFTTFVYCFWQGTSMASPHVAGAAALLLDANPGLTVQQVGDCLRDTTLDRGAPGYDTVYGHGLIQVRDALDSCGDYDGDGVPNDVDNCPDDYNPGQEDNESDGIGDVCDPDDDNDTVLDGDDNCPDDANTGQEDTDGDGLGDACDDDDDNDLMPDTYEQAHACLDPLLADGKENADGDELRNYPEMVVGTAPCVADPELALDSDADGWSDGKERYIGTDPDDDCPDDTSDDAWPPDQKNDGNVNILDVVKYRLKLEFRGYPYDPRYDLKADVNVNILDIVLYRPVILTSCTNP